jgi:ABC-2 type transport system permease protein
MQSAPAEPRAGASLQLEQARALLWLRFTLWRRRLVQERQWARAIISLLALAMAAGFSWSISFLILEAGQVMPADSIAARGGPLAIFATWLTMALVARVWFGLITVGQMASFLDPRRFLIYAVPPRLMGALNLGAQLFEPTWLLLYAPIVCIGVAISRMQGAPSLWGLFVAEGFAVISVVGLLHLAAALAATFDARPFLRRGFSVVLLFAGFAAFELSLARPGRPGVAELFAGHHWRLIALTPPGWAAVLAQALSDGRPLHALTPALLLLLLGAGGSLAAHRLSQRELLRPPQPHLAGASAARERGWSLPLVSGAFSALLEKEAKTAVRVGWLQLVLVPVGFLMLRSFAASSFVGRMPLLVAALYAHLGVLEIATNAFGRDLGGARAYFLWPVPARAVLAAKNVVAYAFSLAIFGSLAVVAGLSSRVTAGQLAVGLCAHAATFPLLATFGNVASVLFPSPVRGARLRRVRGAGPVGARFFAMGLLALAAWAPYWLARLLQLPLGAAYLGELFAMALAYGGLLALSAELFESRRERLLAALSRDE